MTEELAADSPHLVWMAEQVETNTRSRPEKLSADPGYYSEGNLTAIDQRAIEAFIPPDRVKHTDAAKAPDQTRAGPLQA